MSHYEEEDYEEEPYEVQYDNEDKKRPFVTKDGKASAIFPNQDTYTGEYKEKKRNGKGMYKWERKNASYVGDYVDGFREGNGIMTFPDGSVYHGQWKMNARHGHGVYTYPNGDKYCGAWENNIRSGAGTYIYYSSRTQVSGQWVAGQCLDGQIAYYDENLIQAHEPFIAQVRNNRITKYIPSVSTHPRVVFAEKPSDQPIEQPAEETTQEAVKEPVEEPVEEPAKESVEEPIEEPTELPIEDPVEEPVQEPVEEPVEEPTVEPAVEELKAPESDEPEAAEVNPAE